VARFSYHLWGVEAFAARERIRLVVLPAGGGTPTQLRLYLFHIEPATMRPAMSSRRSPIVTFSEKANLSIHVPAEDLLELFDFHTDSSAAWRQVPYRELCVGRLCCRPLPEGGCWLNRPPLVPPPWVEATVTCFALAAVQARVRTSR
jgi:hypothetical protein